MDILETTVPPYALLNNTELFVVKHVTVRMRHVIMFIDAILRRVSTFILFYSSMSEQFIRMIFMHPSLGIYGNFFFSMKMTQS